MKGAAMSVRGRLAVAMLTGAVMSAPAGAYLEWGAGKALLVLAGGLFAGAVLVGWGSD
jgi:hypothetical protein